MRFGKSAAEAAQDDRGAGSGGDFIRYLKDGDNTLRITQEPEEWIYYFEHYSPMGFSFPCPRQSASDPLDLCPGCSSDNEKMKKLGKKIAFNAIQSFNGTDYVNAWKVGPIVEGKLLVRYERYGTITDRDYTITRYKGKGDRYDFDVEGAPPTPVDLRKAEWKDIEGLLVASYEENWGDGAQARANRLGHDEADAEQQAVAKVRATIAPKPVVAQEEPPFEPPEPKEYREEELRAMDRGDLVLLIKTDLGTEVPDGLGTTNAVVDWLMDNQS